MISRLFSFVRWRSVRVCRHEAGTICVHRHYEYDLWYRGYIDGWGAGRKGHAIPATDAERIADDNGDELEHGEPDFPRLSGELLYRTIVADAHPRLAGHRDGVR